MLFYRGHKHEFSRSISHANFEEVHEERQGKRKAFFEWIDPDNKWLDRIIIVLCGTHWFVFAFATALGNILCFCAKFCQKRKRRLLGEVSPSSRSNVGTREYSFGLDPVVPVRFNKRILFSGCAGLHFYQAGVTTAILEKYGHRLRNEVSFEGISGGTFTAAFALAAVRGVRSMPYWLKHCGMPIYYNARDRFFGMIWTTSNLVHTLAAKYYKLCQEATGEEVPEHLRDGSFAIWITNVRTLSSVPVTEIPNPDALAEAFTAGSYIPLVLDPGFWWRLDQQDKIDIGLDGGMAPFLGDTYPFATHSEAGPVKTLWIEAWPSLFQDLKK